MGTKKENTVIEEKTVSVAEKKAELKKLRELEVKEAFAKINAICNEYQVALNAEITLTANSITPRISLIDIAEK